MVILANIISLAGAVIMVMIGFIRERDRILKAQCVQWIIMGIANAMLGGVTGLISNLVSVVRNLWSLKRELTRPVILVFIALQIALSAPFNTLGLLGWLPTIAAVSFTLFLNARDPRVLKWAIIFGQVLWAVFDFSLMNYTAFAFDIFTIISSLVGIWQLRNGSPGRASAVPAPEKSARCDQGIG